MIQRDRPDDLQPPKPRRHCRRSDCAPVAALRSGGGGFAGLLCRLVGGIDCPAASRSLAIAPGSCTSSRAASTRWGTARVRVRPGQPVRVRQRRRRPRGRTVQVFRRESSHDQLLPAPTPPTSNPICSGATPTPLACGQLSRARRPSSVSSLRARPSCSAASRRVTRTCRSRARCSSPPRPCADGSDEAANATDATCRRSDRLLSERRTRTHSCGPR